MGSSGGLTFASGMVDNGNAAAAAVPPGMETLSRFGLSDLPGSSGRLWINYTTCAVTTTVSQLTIVSGSTATVGGTLGRLAIFSVAADGSVTLVARCASDTGIGAATFTSYQRSLATAGGFPATYTLIAGTRYGLGWLQTAGTAMSISGAFEADSGGAPIACRIIAGETDIQNSYAVASLTTHFQECYIAARP